MSLWKAADLTAVDSTPTGETPVGARSDGANFWITLGANHLAQY